MVGLPPPPKSVPGPYNAPAAPPGIPAQRLPGVRYYYPNGNETLDDVARKFYGNPREAVALFNANRSGQLRADRAPGFLLTLNDLLPPGVPLVLP
jgi:nucleoid-associated protein YgaU